MPARAGCPKGTRKKWVKKKSSGTDDIAKPGSILSWGSGGESEQQSSSKLSKRDKMYEDEVEEYDNGQKPRHKKHKKSPKPGGPAAPGAGKSSVPKKTPNPNLSYWEQKKQEYSEMGGSGGSDNSESLGSPGSAGSRGTSSGASSGGGKKVSENQRFMQQSIAPPFPMENTCACPYGDSGTLCGDSEFLACKNGKDPRAMYSCEKGGARLLGKCVGDCDMVTQTLEGTKKYHDDTCQGKEGK